MRLTGAKSIPVVELVAIRIVELAQAGEFDPDKLTEAVAAEFDGWMGATSVGGAGKLSAHARSIALRKALANVRAADLAPIIAEL